MKHIQGIQDGEEAVKVDRVDALQDDRIFNNLAFRALASGRREREHRGEYGRVALEEVTVHTI
jgi:hypothetical protein